MTDERLQTLYQQALARRTAGGGACPAPEALLALARREGGEAERLATLDHVMACGAGCREELELLRAIERAGGATSATSSGAGAGVATDTSVRPIRPARRWLAPALAAAGLVVAVGVGRGLRHGDEAVVRGDSDEAGDVRLVAPAAGATVVAPATLAWHPLPGAHGYVVEVLGDDGRVAASARTADTTAAVAVAPGTYRWWVRADAAGDAAHSALRALVVRAR